MWFILLSFDESDICCHKFRCTQPVKFSGKNQLSHRMLTPFYFENSKIILRFSVFSLVLQSKNTCCEIKKWKKIEDRDMLIRAFELHYNINVCANKSGLEKSKNSCRQTNGLGCVCRFRQITIWLMCEINER